MNDTLEQRGMQTIATAQPTGNFISLELDGVVFRQMFEYAVVDFVREVGFFSEVFGFSIVAMTSGYALFTTPGGDFHFSFRLADELQLTQIQGIKLLFMTGNLDSAESHFRATGLIADLAVREGSPSQRVLHLNSPAGLPIETWEDPSPQG